MINTATKQNNIKYIPTELNAFTYLKHNQTKQQRTITSYCMWLVALLIWNIAITVFLIYDNIELIPAELQPIPQYELMED